MSARAPSLGVLAGLRRRLAAIVGGGRSPAAGASMRMYSHARDTRTTGGFGGGNASADAELASSLAKLRSRSRQMVRDSAYAKRARSVVVNNVIGAGVGLQANVMTTRDQPASRVNREIEREFAAWAAADSCHTGGAMHLGDLERAAMGQVFEAGEVFVRKHYARFGASRVPLALELIEPERLASEMVEPGSFTLQGEVRMGVEVDSFGRALAYWLRQRHPGDLKGHVAAHDRFERVPAEDIFHLRIVTRWPQTRGEPWMHTVLRKLDDMAEYTGLELTAARGSASYFATIETNDETPFQPDDEQEEDGVIRPVMDIDPLTIQRLSPGTKLNFHSPNRPNSALDPFIRHMLREVAAGVGVSYESLSRDYSQSNYSSSRLALIDDRDLYRTLQQWWIRAFREPLHALWMQQAALAGVLTSVSVAEFAVAPQKFTAARFKPRGWSWVDPTKEVNAYKEAIRAGMTTLTDVIAQTANGQDLEDVIETRKRELEALAEAGITTDTDPGAQVMQAPAAADSEPEQPQDDEPQTPARVFRMNRG